VIEEVKDVKKRFLLIPLGIIIAIFATFFAWRYIKYLHDPDPYKTFLIPRLALSQVEIASVTTEKTELKAKIVIKNQMPLPFVIDSIRFVFSIDSDVVAKSLYNKIITLRGNDSSSIELPITIFNQVIGTGAKTHTLNQIDSVVYRFQGTIYTNIPLIKQFNIDIKKLSPRFRIPDIQAGHIIVDTLNFTTALIQIPLAITNANAFSLKAKNIAFEFTIDGKNWLKGLVPGMTDIRAANVTELQIPVRISIKETIRTLFRLLKHGNSVQYTIRLICTIESEHPMVKNSKVRFENTGSVKALLKAVKK
jgi:LEA14-like dessication related protein